MSADDQTVATISVVIPAYNAALFLARAVRSALQQTYPVLEVIIVDDGSADGTLSIAHSLASENQLVKVMGLETNRGPSAARNAGFAAAKGDWISVLDADDAYLPDRLQHMMALADGADIIADNLLPYDAAKDAIGRAASKRTEGWEEIDLATFADARRDHDDFGLFQPMFRQGFLRQHRLRYPEDVRHGEDFLLVFEALARGAVYRLTWAPGYLCTMRSSGWSRTQIDYAGMRKRLAALSNRNDLSLSANVREKLRDRAAYTSDMELREQVKNALRHGRLLPAIVIAATHPVIWKFAYAKLKRSLRSYRARGKA